MQILLFVQILDCTIALANLWSSLWWLEVSHCFSLNYEDFPWTFFFIIYSFFCFVWNSLFFYDPPSFCYILIILTSAKNILVGATLRHPRVSVARGAVHFRRPRLGGRVENRENLGRLKWIAPYSVEKISWKILWMMQHAKLSRYLFSRHSLWW